MISNRARGLFHVLILCQSLLAGLAIFLGINIATEFFGVSTIFRLETYPIYWGLTVLGLIAEALNRDPQKVASDLFQKSILHQHSVSWRQTLFAAGALVIYLAMAKDVFISRTVLLLMIPALYGALLWSNYVLPARLARRIFAGRNQERTLLIGSSSRAAGLKRWLENKRSFGLLPVGILNDESKPLGTIPHLGSPSLLREVLVSHAVTQAILLELPENPESHGKLVRILDEVGVRLLIVSNLEEKLRHPAIHFRDEGLSFVAPREEKLENPVNRLLKRVLDLAVALPMVVFVMPPLCVLTWLLHRWQSPGPLFFRQIRAGIQNREFEIIKFRSMHLDDGDLAGQFSHGGDRVFSGGRWLRDLRIDEIPQFLNVLRGEMSVVGPRPHVVQHNHQFSKLMARYHIRAVVKPGITGLAQVRGFRGDVQSAEDIRHRLESDIYYLENWRFAFDLSIIFRTGLQLVLFSVSAIISPRKKFPFSSKATNADTSFELAPLNWNEQQRGSTDRRILGIRFFTGSPEEAVAIGMKGGMVVAPSAPVLLGMEEDADHRAAVVGSRMAITDSGLMVLLWGLITGEKIARVSGLAYLKALLERPELKEPGQLFLVMPNKASMTKNLAWLQSKGFPVTEESCYVAPEYERAHGQIADLRLLEIAREKRPKHIVMAIGGGVQEKLGAYLQQQLDYEPAIHCTGAAIAFLSGDQIRIPMWADRVRLGWLCRCLSEPLKFIPRYWEARKLVNLMFRYHGRLPGSETAGPVLKRQA